MGWLGSKLLQIDRVTVQDVERCKMDSSWPRHSTRLLGMLVHFPIPQVVNSWTPWSNAFNAASACASLSRRFLLIRVLLPVPTLWEETVANELVLHAHSSSISTRSGPLTSTAEPQEESSRGKTKDSKIIKSGRPSHDEKKVGKSHDEKRARARKMREFHNIKISQVELLVIYEGSRFAGKKFKDKAHSQREPSGNAIPDGDLNFSDSDDGQAGKSDQFPISWLKRPSDGAGDGFVTSIRGLFNSQRRKAKAFVLRTMRGDPDSEFHGEWSDSDVEFSPFARQLTITKARRLIRRHTKKFRSRGQKGTGSQQIESLPPSPRENTPFESDYSSGSSPYEDFNE
ncbi:hypothetical protein IFM89_038189 [Coptis chinensis]|uniref:Uncharacterized protein n=1 Tax=Coptis chinensis TaxID=261450 RepID=A0A835IIG6_9MAGN|nr:hypothetical protein IFM89_038189 [Coptis chinensis]